MPYAPDNNEEANQANEGAHEEPEDDVPEVELPPPMQPIQVCKYCTVCFCKVLC